MAAQAEGELTHEEVWDDSALVQSWDEALEEYKKYHSMARRGEKVNTTTTKQTAQANGVTNSNAPANFVAAPSQPAPTAPQIGAAPPPSLANLPQALLGSTVDENMKNMMMSWYYAGYYTGLYDGQQKAWAEMQQGEE